MKKLYGSLAFVSRYAIRGYESSRRDDLESFGYMLIYLAKGGYTPWMKYKKGNINVNFLEKIITKIRMEMTDENLCKGLPDEFVHYMKYVKQLGFEQEPNYEYLNSLFVSILSKNAINKNLTFFWIKQKPKKKEIILTENSERNYLSKLTPNKNSKNDLKSNFIKRLYSKIKDSLINNSSKKTIPSISLYENYHKTNDKITKSENKINLNIQIFNTNTNNNNINVNSTQRNSAYRNKTGEKTKFPKPKSDNIKYKPLLPFDNISSKSNTKLNLKTNYISLIRNNNNKNHIGNKIIDNNNKILYTPIKLNNNSFNQNKNFILCERTNNNNKNFFIKGNYKTPKNNFEIKKKMTKLKVLRLKLL